MACLDDGTPSVAAIHRQLAGLLSNIPLWGTHLYVSTSEMKL